MPPVRIIPPGVIAPPVLRNALAAGLALHPAAVRAARRREPDRPRWAPDPLAPVARVDRALAALQVQGTRYTPDEQARHPRPTGGAAARELLRSDPDAALAELVDVIHECGTLADWARLRGLAYTTARAWVAADAHRAAEYEAARDDRLLRLADDVVRIADESTARTGAEFARDRARMRSRMILAERTMPGRFGRRMTEVHERAAAAARARKAHAETLARPGYPGRNRGTNRGTKRRLHASSCANRPPPLAREETSRRGSRARIGTESAPAARFRPAKHNGLRRIARNPLM